jgi:lipopolysaccharide export system permease protein
MKPTLYRSILAEILTPLILGIIAFTAVLLMGRMVKLTDMVIAKGVPLSEVGRLVLYLLPSYAVLTIPMAFLLAVLLAFGRLSTDSETTAMKACGISLYDMLPPVLAAASLATLATAWCSLALLPSANLSFRTLVRDIAESRINLAMKEKVFIDTFPDIILYTDRYDERSQRMAGVLIQDERDAGSHDTIFAREGVLVSDPVQQTIRLRLDGGSIHRQERGNQYRLVTFDTYLLSIDLKASKTKPFSRRDQLSLGELRQAMGSADLAPDEQRRHGLEFHTRFALPASCLVFALSGVPLGLQNRRSGRAGGFSLAIGAMILYFIVLSIGESLGEQGILHPAVAAWLPNLLFLALGCIAFWFAATERPLPLAGAIVLLRERLAVLLRPRRKP